MNAEEVAALRLITRRWTFEILMVLSEGGARYTELLRGLPGINQRILTERLKDLEAMGLVDRDESREPPRRRDAAGPGRVQVTYSLNDTGVELQPALRALRSWIQATQVQPSVAGA